MPEFLSVECASIPPIFCLVNAGWWLSHLAQMSSERNRITLEKESVLFSVTRPGQWFHTDLTSLICQEWQISRFTSSVFFHLIFLSSWVNIWREEGRFKSDTGWEGGHERGPSWMQLAPRVKFQTSGPRHPTNPHTCAHNLLPCVHERAPLKSLCKMFSVETWSS